MMRGRRTEEERRAYRFLATRWKARNVLIMGCNIHPDTLDGLVKKGWASAAVGGLGFYKKRSLSRGKVQ